MIPTERKTGKARQLFDHAPAKPPYRVPTMAEIAKIRWNGLTAVDLFSGYGGTCLGFRMSGFRVLWASEFVPAAQESYRANMRKGTILDCRDVKKVHAAEILSAAGLKSGELDCLTGSPPCQGFSRAGLREEGWGKGHKYAHGAVQNNEELFSEYIRVRNGLMPRTFMAENVGGLVRGKAKGFFLEILAELKQGYRVEVRVLDAQWLGVPQRRQRVIFVGVRNDLGLDPAFPCPLPYRYSVRDALPWLDGGGPRNHFLVEKETDISRFAIGAEYDRLNPGQQSDRYFNLFRASASEPSPTVLSSSGFYESAAAVMHPTEKRRFSIAELKRICGAPDDVVLTGSFANQWERLGNSVPPVMAMWMATALRDRVLLPARAPGTRKAKPRGSGKVREPSRGASEAATSRAPRSPSRDLSSPTDAE